ncbi:hypothetical protein C8R41DRAFT_507690 [Lentinula lateritia]|uniref:Ubinuclein middle domain-containing protein n=1 Tax=Lentinula lateritia TaxID=40482 RepID=A0ABQ8V7Q6_9AGAR|nr:hypothetical protein C8R41DRAFT_507690 [Lentinula lateritia]
MEEQDVTMSSADAEPSPTTIISSDHELDMRRHSPSQQNGQNGVDDPPPSPGAESVSTGAASSDDGDSDEDEDEGAEENERVDENGAIVIDDDDDDDDERGGTSNDIQEPSIIIKDEPSPSNAAPVLLNESKNAPKPNSETANKAENHLPPPTSTATTKPKSKAKAKARSPSPLPIAPLPLQTVRLAIKLGGPDNYTVDISGLAKESGQRPLTPVPKRQDESSDSEIEKAKVAEANQSGSEKPKKKKKNVASEYYDVSDPFIDDSELAVDDRKFFAQTKQQGFYVSSGEVALMKDRSPKKPKSKKHNTEAGPSSQHPRISLEGTKESPIALMDDEDDSSHIYNHQSLENGHAKAGGDRKKKNLHAAGATHSRSPSAAQYGTGLNAPLTGNLAVMRKLNWIDPDPNHGHADGDNEGYGDGGEKVGMKRKRVSYTTVVENGKKRKIVDIASFDPALQANLQRLKEAIAAENWDQKGKFPPSIKPLLAQIAIHAITLDEYDDHFFNLMPSLFPYNKFTMSKLIKRTVFADHLKLLVERQDALLTELKRQADEGFTKAEDEWEKSVVAWDHRQKRLKADHREDSGSTGAPTRHPTEDPDNHGDGFDEDNNPLHPQLMSGTGDPGSAAQKPQSEKDVQPPAKKYRLTENMKAIVWELVLLSNECCRLENEKNTLEGSVMQVSEQGLRKMLYQKIVSSFPPGWMSSGQISRDVSAMKKRLEKELAEEQEMDGTPA